MVSFNIQPPFSRTENKNLAPFVRVRLFRTSVETDSTRSNIFENKENVETTFNIRRMSNVVQMFQHFQHCFQCCQHFRHCGIKCWPLLVTFLISTRTNSCIPLPVIPYIWLIFIGRFMERRKAVFSGPVLTVDLRCIEHSIVT